MSDDIMKTPGVSTPTAEARESFAKHVHSSFPGGRHLVPHVNDGPFHAVAVFCRNQDLLPPHSYEVLNAYPRVRMRVYDWENDLDHAVVALVPQLAFEILADESDQEAGRSWIGMQPAYLGSKEPNPRQLFQHLHNLWNMPHVGCTGIDEDPEYLDENACELSDCDPALEVALETLEQKADLEVFLEWADRAGCWTNTDGVARRDLVLAYAAALT